MEQIIYSLLTVNRVNVFKNKVDKYLRRAGYTYIKNVWTLDKPMASLSTCHLGLCLAKSCDIHAKCDIYHDVIQMN